MAPLDQFGLLKKNHGLLAKHWKKKDAAKGFEMSTEATGVGAILEKSEWKKMQNAVDEKR